MKTVRIYCRKCHLNLTENLIEVDENILREQENEDAIDKNCFSINTANDRKQFIVAIDKYYLIDHTDSKRFQGCCGSMGSNGHNKLCANGHEVATEISDCWLPHYIEFDLDKVIVKEIKSEYEFKIITF